MTEADLGRLSVIRAPDAVLDRALAEMVTTLSAVDGDAGERITLDPAGRLVAVYDLDGLLIEKTIDAPAENAAAFQRILEETALYHADVDNGEPIVLPVFPGSDSEAVNLLDRTAPLLGASGPVALRSPATSHEVAGRRLDGAIPPVTGSPLAG